MFPQNVKNETKETRKTDKNISQRFTLKIILFYVNE